jgi:hypothetical protein
LRECRADGAPKRAERPGHDDPSSLQLTLLTPAANSATLQRLKGPVSHHPAGRRPFATGHEPHEPHERDCFMRPILCVSVRDCRDATQRACSGKIALNTENTEEEENTERKGERFAPLNPPCRGSAAPKAQ